MRNARRSLHALRSWVLPALAVLVCSSCFSFTYTRTLRNEPVDLAAGTDLLHPGTSLASCLERLGAPTHVFEDKVHGLLLVWAWARDRQYGASVSVQVSNSGSASLSFQDLWERQHGLVLWFDRDWRLVNHDSGFLHQLIGERPTPSTLEQIEAGG